MNTLWQDVLYGFRMLLKKPGFTAVAALSLALGIGANTVVFSLLNATLLRPLDFPHPEKLVVLWTVSLQHRDERNNMNVSSYFAFRDQAKSYAALGAFNGVPRNLGAEQNGAVPERVIGETFTPSMFRAIGVKPQLGRLFNDDEDPVDHPAPVVVISDRLWQRHFNRDPNVIGKTLIMDKRPITVIGVMPKDFNFFGGGDTEFWEPIEISRTQVQSTQGFLVVVARLKDGVSMSQAQAEIDTLAAQQAIADPERNQGKGVRIQRLQEAAYGNLQSPLLILQGAVAFVLLIGCANVAGLLLARAASRRTEVAVRSALGAGRWRIVRQLVTEGIPLSVLGGILGVFLGWGGLKLFVAAAPPNFPRLEELSLDARVLGFTALVVILTGVVFAIAPAIQASKADLVNSLKESGGRSGTDSVARQHLRSAMVTAQIALALILLIGAGLMINSFVRVQRVDVGANPKGLLTFEFRFPQNETIKPFARYRGVGLWDVSPQTTLTFDRIFDRIQGMPGVISAAGINRTPLFGQGIPMPFLIEGRPAPPPTPAGQQPAQGASYFAITPKFFGTMQIPILRGRDFTAQDSAAGAPVVIVNQTLARRFFANESPIGKRITLDFVPDEKAREIVGVVGDTVVNRLEPKQVAILYIPHVQQTPRWLGPFWNDRAAMVFVTRTSGDPMNMVQAVRQAVAEVDSNKPPANFGTVEKTLDQQVQYLRLYILLLGIFGGIAAILAAIGIYGVMSYAVAERTREIGIRMALGAEAADVLKLIVMHAAILVSIGLALGLAGSLALTRLIKSALVGVTATDPATYAGVSALLILVALLACLIPTRRAVAVDPTIALRYE